MFITKSNFIKNAIIDLCENEDVYSTRILYRSLIEHGLKHQYLYLRWAKDKNDSVGEEYYEFCNFSEDLSYLKAIQYANRLAGQTTTKEEPFSILNQLKQQSTKYSSTLIEEKARQFSYRKIVEYILSTVKTENLSPFLCKLILEYSELSSFVHGGPFSENEFYRLSAKAERDQQLINIASNSFLIATDIKLNAFVIFLNTNRDYEKGYTRIHSILDNFKKH